MSIVPKNSVRFHVALAVLVMITLSWLLSTGIANYMSYLSIKSVRQEMLKHPAAYPGPIPDPQFGVLDFFSGRPPRAFERRDAGPRPPPGTSGPDMAPPAEPPFPQGPSGNAPPPSFGRQGPRGAPPPRYFSPLELRWVLLRLTIALGLAALAAMWIGRRLTRPLLELARGAGAFRSRDFGYRIQVEGNSEFTDVAAAMNDMAQETSQHIRTLEEDAERRRQFLADVAHELRSPVTTMRTMAGALQDGTADEPQRRERAVSALVRTSERMFRLVQDVMELVELDLDRLPIARTETDLRGLVAGVIASYETEAAKTGVALKPLESGAPIKASVDPDRITQVLDNIVGNAVSYAGKGALVSVVLQDGDPVRISIIDTGIGIPAKDLPHILDSFYRVSAARTPDENHVGLGLSIARRMIEAHGGQLTIASTEGKGTTVTILIPKADPTPALPTLGREPSA